MCHNTNFPPQNCFSFSTFSEHNSPVEFQSLNLKMHLQLSFQIFIKNFHPLAFKHIAINAWNLKLWMNWTDVRKTWILSTTDDQHLDHHEVLSSIPTGEATGQFPLPRSFQQSS